MNSKKPWLKPNGQPVTDTALRRISKKWDLKTWNSYLKWFEGKRKYELLEPSHYDSCCETLVKSVYEEFGSQSNPALQNYFGVLIGRLSRRHQKAIRLYYHEGVAPARIGKSMKISRQRFHVVKAQALSELAAQIPPLAVDVFRLVRGLDSQKQIEPVTIWTRKCPAAAPIREDRTYLPSQWQVERTALRNPRVKNAVDALSDFQWQIAYRIFWCDQPQANIARDLGVGINAVQDICDVATFKIKAHVAAHTNLKEEYAS